MLATNPVDPATTFRSPSLTSIGAHSHVERNDGRRLGAAVTLLGAAVLLVIGYILGGAAAVAG
ncbi:MAG TPA: hypothetical protein VKB30_03810 [Candidatus Limnocylindrales bacterium]|nr:hypothetical protein [Candidatus Limnocylindrales bacterium]